MAKQEGRAPGRRHDPSPRRGRSPRAALAVAALAFATITAVGALSGTARSATSAVTSNQYVTIMTPDGVRLSARVEFPLNGSNTSLHPLVIVPGSLGEAPVSVPGMTLAGFEVVSYAERGMGGSAGQADFGGTLVSDFETVLNWTLANTAADPHEIAAMGMSLGAGAVLMGAAADSRVRAVVAVSPWATLTSMLVPNNTLKTSTVASILSGQRLSSAWAQIRTDVTVSPVHYAAASSLIASLSPQRSPLNVIDQLNARQVPVLLGGALQDTVTPAADAVTLFDALTGPKRLFLVQGDHGEVLSAPAEAANGMWYAAVYWFQHYVAGQSVPDSELNPTVGVLDQRNSLHPMGAWPGTAAQPLSIVAGGRIVAPGSGNPTWTSTIAVGAATQSDSPTYTWSTATYVPRRIKTSAFVAGHQEFWAQAPLSRTTLVCGTPTLSVAVRSNTRAVSLYAYLYAVSPAGTGDLLSVTPDTLNGLTSSTPHVMSIPLAPICESVPARDHLAVAIDTVDAHYANAGGKHSTVTFSSTAASPALMHD